MRERERERVGEDDRKRKREAKEKKHSERSLQEEINNVNIAITKCTRRKREGQRKGTYSTQPNRTTCSKTNRAAAIGTNTAGQKSSNTTLPGGPVAGTQLTNQRCTTTRLFMARFAGFTLN